MHPEISLFPSKTFYDSRLKDGEGMAKLWCRPWHHSNILAPYRFFDVEGMHQSVPKGHSLVNIAELNVAMQLYDRLTTDCRKYDFRGKVGIITPYKGQLKELRARFTQRYGQAILSAIEFNTTDAFQGRESEVVIFSCVRASTKGIGFLNDVRRMNVGLTRAKCSLWVLGNSQSLMQGEFWRGLVTDAKARHLYTDGDVLSLLRRPILTEDMMKDDVEMTGTNSPTTVVVGPRTEKATIMSPVESSSRKSSTSLSGVFETHSATPLEVPAPVQRSGSNLPARPSSAVSRTSSTSNPTTAKRAENETKAQHESSEPRKVSVSGPSGGRTGFNPHAMCNICGSDAHFSHACDNIAAREASVGKCLRCKNAGHLARMCDVPRCLECGEVGHLGKDCLTDPKQRLTKKERGRVQLQESEFGRERERARERRAQKQLGEHVAKVPVVKSSVQSTGFRSSDAGIPSGPSSAMTEGKRKREEMAPVDAPKGPKSMKTSNGPAKASNDRPSTVMGSGGPVDSGPARNGTAIRPGLGRPPLGAGMVKKKKPTDDDMFMKKR